MLKKIAERNEQFESADRMTQRVMIAKDVLEQIRLKELIPTWGTYVTRNWRGPGCLVCALGGLAVSVMDGEAVGRTSGIMRDELSPYFSRDELDLIESLFEGWKLESKENGTTMDCSKWYTKDPTDRMRRIMQSIIDNDGELRRTDIAPNLRWRRTR